MSTLKPGNIIIDGNGDRWEVIEVTERDRYTTGGRRFFINNGSNSRYLTYNQLREWMTGERRQPTPQSS